MFNLQSIAIINYAPEACGVCKGTGEVMGNICKSCKGQGSVLVAQPGLRCGLCGGSGRVKPSCVCHACDGAGWGHVLKS